MKRPAKGLGRRLTVALVVFTIGAIANPGMAQQSGTAVTDAAVTYATPGWSDADRNTFYTTTQGSHMMPYAFFKALQRVDADEPFSADHLQRYGYLPNAVSASNPEGLPVGFVIDGSVAPEQLGMTCAACHTAQLEYRKNGVTTALRLDGAPANADFQQFLVDLLAAAQATLAQPDRFDSFAKTVLGTSYSEANAAPIKVSFQKWADQFDEFMTKSLPQALPWGPGRLDAFGMIFNRVAARDLGIVENFKPADAPVSYPFLWNASKQDHTQWNGGVPNGLFIQALGRNAGEVFGVFADFSPARVIGDTPVSPAFIDFSHNSANFANLQTLEEKIVALRPPMWPRDLFGLDDALAQRGKPLFDANCGTCHNAQDSSIPNLWRTQVVPVGTDPRTADNSARSSQSGPLKGALLPPPAILARIGQQAPTADILATAVVGSLFAEALPKPFPSLALPQLPSLDKLASSGVFQALRKDYADHLGTNLDQLLNPNQPVSTKTAAVLDLVGFINGSLTGMFKPPAAPHAYEARVLQGVWATAPYLHNGSVPNLWELLKPANQRMSMFMVGSRLYDPKNVGYVTDQSPFKNGTFVADPMNANGNGNGGHEYGTTLSEEDRWAIIEYMKTL
jgi:hypothetical protein